MLDGHQIDLENVEIVDSSILFRFAQPNRKHFYYKDANNTVCGGSRQQLSLLQSNTGMQAPKQAKYKQ